MTKAKKRPHAAPATAVEAHVRLDGKLAEVLTKSAKREHRSLAAEIRHTLEIAYLGPQEPLL